jgi:hypothetical protein
VREPAAGLRGREQLGERRIHRRRLLAVDGMAGPRHHQQRGGRHGPLEKHAAVEAEIVLVSDDY